MCDLFHHAVGISAALREEELRRSPARAVADVQCERLPFCIAGKHPECVLLHEVEEDGFGAVLRLLECFEVEAGMDVVEPVAELVYTIYTLLCWGFEGSSGGPILS